MTERVATTPGLFPLPDPAKRELSDRKGHQKGDLISGDESDELESVYERYRADVIESQSAAGLDRIVEGQLRWDDMLAHPLAVHESVDTGGIVRYYDNNNFYRDPRVQGELTFSGDVAAELEAASELTGSEQPLQAVMPGPYSLFDLATDDHYGDEGRFLDAIAEFLAGEIEAFPAHETLFLLEPSLVESPPGDGLDERASEAIDAVAAASDANVVVHTYFGALEEKLYAHLMDADVEAIGFDIVSGDREETLYNITEYGTKDEIALGLVDGQNTLIESPETIDERVRWVDEQVSSQAFDRIYLTTNTEPFYLPVSKHRAKLEALAEAAAIGTDEETTGVKA